MIPCAPSPIEINRTTPVRDEIAEVREVRDKPARSAILLNRCVARAHSTTDAREALADLGYDVLTTAVPRREVYAQSFGVPIKQAAATCGARWPATSSSAAPRSAASGHDRAERQGAAQGADGGRARPGGPSPTPARRGGPRSGSKPVRITLDLSPELYRELNVWADEAAIALGVPRVSLADAVRAMIRVTADHPDQVPGPAAPGPKSSE